MRTPWLPHELGLPFEVAARPFDRTLREPGHLAPSPAGRVPALEIEGEVLLGSGAIAEVLCERFSPEGLGRPPGHPERARWLVGLRFAESVSQHAAALTQQHMVLHEDAMRSPTVPEVEARRLEKCDAALDARLARGGPHLLPSGFTAADMGVGQAVHLTRRFARSAPFPQRADRHAKITARPAFLAPLPGEGERLHDREFHEPGEAARG